jgi:hypothetical protein
VNEVGAISKEECLQMISAAGASLAAEYVPGRFQWGSELGFEADVEQYVERNILRASALLDDTALLVNGERLLGAAASMRASLETIVVLVDFFRRFKSAVKRVDGGEIKRVLGSYIFASLEFSEVSQQKTPNVMDAIRAADKRRNGMIAVYSILCETVHPNWSGRIQEGSATDINWYGATVQRLIVAMAISASFSTILVRDLDDFSGFVRSNRKNVRNAILF